MVRQGQHTLKIFWTSWYSIYLLTCFFVKYQHSFFCYCETLQLTFCRWIYTFTVYFLLLQQHTISLSEYSVTQTWRTNYNCEWKKLLELRQVLINIYHWYNLYIHKKYKHTNKKKADDNCCCIKLVLLVLRFSNCTTSQSIILANTFLMHIKSAPCFNILYRKILDESTSHITEEVA